MMQVSSLKPYLLVLNLSEGARQEVLDFLDTQPAVKNWFAFFPSAVFIVSSSDAHVLSDLVHNRFPTRNFVITEVPMTNNNGWLPQNIWDFVNNPKSSGRWP